MAKIPVLDAVRIIPRDPDFLNRKSGSRGEIFFDQNENTLRLYDGLNNGGTNLAKSDLTNIADADFLAKAVASGVGIGSGGNVTVSVSASTPATPSSGNLWLNTNNGSLYVFINDGDSQQWVQPAVPTPSGYATEEYVDLAVSNVEFTLATASTSVLGGVKIDGTTITINNGVISSQLPTATTSVLGGVKIDGTTITINNGVISGTVPTIFDQELNTTDDVVFNTVTAGQLISDGVGVPTYTSGSDFIFNTGNNLGAIVVNGSVEITSVVLLTPLATAPASTIGSIAVANGLGGGWDPASKGLNSPYPVFYDGNTWRALY